MNTARHEASGTSATAPTDASTAPSWGRWLVVSVAVLVVDQLTKALVQGAFQPGDELRITGFFSLVLAYNTGAAFSFLAGAGGWQRWFFTAIAVVASLVITWLLKRGGSRIYCLGLAAILGGAIGNLVDRVLLGKVVDFLLFHYAGWFYPAFNVADSAITVGAGLIIIDSFRRRHPAARTVESSGDP
jgi:signal peptidase II